MRTIIFFLFAAITTGCAEIGNFIIPAHSNSEAKDPDAVCISLNTEPQESPVALALPLAKFGAKLLVEQAAKAIKKESERYSSTYSARYSNNLFIVKNSGKDNDGNDILGPGLQWKEIQVTRFYGIGEKDGKKVEPQCGIETEKVMEFKANIDISAQKDAIRFIPVSFYMSKSKSKVAAPSPWKPWSWWMWLDNSRGKTDVNIQLSMSLIVTTKEGRKQVNLGRFDVPIGKISLDKETIKDRGVLGNLSSNWIPLPEIIIPTNSKVNDVFGSVDIQVTVMEADDLGDVIAKGAAKTEENNENIAAGILKIFGLNEEDKTDDNK
jgi:hypothetical protein